MQREGRGVQEQQLTAAAATIVVQPACAFGWSEAAKQLRLMSRGGSQRGQQRAALTARLPPVPAFKPMPAEKPCYPRL